jgi:hypothetical protein
LNESADDRVLLTTIAVSIAKVISILGVFYNSPDLEILRCVSVLVFGRTLPGDRERAQRGKPQLIHILGWKGGDDMAHRGIDDGNTASPRLEKG